MEPQIRNFAGIEKFIHDSPQEADGFAREWTYLAAKHPEISTFQTPNEFAIWASDPKHKVDHRLWVGKEVRDAYFYIREQHEEKQMQENGVVDHAGIPSGLLGLPFLAAAFLQRPKIIEEDPDFQKLVEKKKKEWLEKNKGLDTNSKDWIDYRYGSLENPEAKTLYQDAESEFRNGEDLGESLSEKEKEQRRKKVASYDKERKKVYKNLNDDSAVVMEKWRIEYHAQALIEEQKKQSASWRTKITKEDEEKIVQQVRKHHWEKFAEKHPEKAAAYAEKHDGIKEAVARSAHITSDGGEATTSIPPRWNAPEKIHRPPDITVEEATKRLESITPPSTQTPPILQRPILPSIGLVDTQGRPIGSIPSVTTPTPLKPLVERQPPPSPGPPSQPTIQLNRSFRFPQQSVPFQTRFPSAQTRFPSSGGRFPTGIGREANLLRPGNAASKLGGAVARQVGSRTLLLLANPVVLSVLFIFIFTFIIVAGIGPASTGEASPETQPGSGSTSTPGQIIPIGQGGTKIASAARQVGGQLLHSTKQRDEINRRGITCDMGAPYVGFHCWTNDKMAQYNYPGDSPYYLQCTEFVWAVFTETDPAYEPFIKLIKGNANEWVNNVLNSPAALQHFDVFYEANQLRPGDIISLGKIGQGAWGHLAIVVQKKGNIIEIAQAATDEKAIGEEWYINDEGKLVPAFSDRASRNSVNGFIRLKTNP